MPLKRNSSWWLAQGLAQCAQRVGSDRQASIRAYNSRYFTAITLHEELRTREQ